MGRADRSVLERISTLSLLEESFKFSRLGQKKICGFPVSSYKNLGRVGRF
jgi:hypothetical protein